MCEGDCVSQKVQKKLVRHLQTLVDTNYAATKKGDKFSHSIEKKLKISSRIVFFFRCTVNGFCHAFFIRVKISTVMSRTLQVGTLEVK